MGSEYGLELVIPDGFIEKLQKADEELEYTAMQAEETKERVIKSFKEMGDQGVDYFLKKLKDMDKMLNGISSKNLSLKGLEQSTKGAARAADDVVKIAESFGQVSQEAPKVDEGVKNVDLAMERMMNDIKQTSQELRLYDEFLQKGLVSLNEYGEGTARTSERLDALMRGYTALAETKEAYKEAENADDMVSMRKQNELERLNETYRSGTSELQKQATEEDRLAKVAQEQAKWEEKQNKDRLNYEKEYVGWFDKAVAKQEKINRLKEEEKRKTYEGAINFSQNATSIAQETQAIKYLTVARDNLSKTDSDYQKKLNILNNTIEKHQRSISNAKGETQQFEKQERSLINTSDQLRRKLGLLFSVSAIEGYMKKMVEVRGEFELQKVALTAILQNKEKADQLWAQTQELALKSPFRLQQLVTFTKQLAAYQVQAESLYDTTKRLADVSAGLGVDMGRLILAYGQVKAANYLRSAEIRQFTEAGINMLGELSKLYTELEGKMVSVGEVQSRVQKRMVSFGDVEEVFKRLTDAGGMFYNMQEKQSETLKGMIAKLGDALDIMLNKVGEANEGVLKGAVQATLNLLQNWQKIGDVVLPILGAIIARMMILKAPDLFKALIAQLGILSDSLKLAYYQATRNKQAFDALSTSAKAASTAFKGWTAVIALVVAALWGLIRAYQSAKKEQDAINKIAADAGNNARILAAKYESLVKIIQDQTSSYQEQKSAIEELKRTYGDILPAEMLEIENIRTMGDEYIKAREAIYSYIEAKAKQKQIDVIEANEGEKLRSIESNIIDGLTKGLRDVLGKQNVQRADISSIITDILQKQREGIIKDVSDARAYLVKAIDKAYEIRLTSSEQTGVAFTEYFKETGHDLEQDLKGLVRSGQNYNNAIEEIMLTSVSSLDAGLRKLETARQKWESADENAKIRKAFESTQNWQFLTDKQKQNIINDLGAFYEKMNEAMPDWSEIVNDPLRFDEETRRFNQMWLRSMVEDLDKQFTKVERNAQGTEQVLKSTWDKFRQDTETKINTQNLEDWQNLIISGIYQFADANKISLEGMNSIVLKAGQTMDDYFKGIQGDVDRLKQDIGQAKLDRENFPNALQPTSDESLRNMEEQLALYEYIMSLYYDAKNADKEGDKADREALNLLKERVKLIQEANKEYEKNLQYFTQEEAAAKTINSYKNAFKQAGISNLLDEKFLTDEGVLNALAQLPINVGGKLRDEALQYMADTAAKVSVELDVDASQRNLKDLKTQVEGLFDGIDIFQDLVKIGFTEDEVRRIFGIEITNTDQLRRRLESMKYEFIGTKGLDEYNAFMRKINEMEDKQNVERLKRYEKYLKRMMSETAEIRIQALQDIQDVMKMSGRSSEEKSAIIEGINREAQKKLQEQQWKQFQESDDYQLLFTDIEHLSTSTATRLRDILDSLKDSLKELTPHQLRQIQTQYEKLDEQIIKHNPFEAVRKSMKDIEGLASETELNNIILSLTQQKEGYQSQIDDLDLILSMKEKGLKEDTLDADTLARVNDLLGLSNEELASMRTEKHEMLDEVLIEMGLTESQIYLYKRLRKAMSEAQNTWKSVMSETKSTLSNIKSAYEALSDGEQSITLEIVDAGLALADASVQAVQFYTELKKASEEAPKLGMALTTTLGIVGLVATAIQTIVNVIKMISSAHDEKLTKDIEFYERRVNRLAEAYDHLSEKIGKAYSFARLALATNEALLNQQEQIASYEAMIEAERSKKKSDSEKLEEWTSKIEELRRGMEDTKNQAVIEAGGLGGEYKSAAESFVDAWMQAFRETGDGLTALNSQFEDFLWDIASKQVLLKAADKFFEPLFEELDSRMTADTSFYDKKAKEIANAKAKEEAKVAQLEDYLNSFEAILYGSARQEEALRQAKKNIENYNKQLELIQEEREKAVQEALMLDDEDYDILKKQYEIGGKNFDEFASRLLESLGFKGGEAEDVLSGLQKGIQGVTEQTAEIIEAYLNSLRFFVNDTNIKLTTLLEAFTNTDGINNPILRELKAQTKLLDGIKSVLDGVVSLSGFPSGGNALKIVMN